MKLTIIEIAICLLLVSLYALALYCWRRMVKKMNESADKILLACRIQA